MILKNPQANKKLKDGRTFYYETKRWTYTNSEPHYKSTLPNISKLKLEEMISEKYMKKPRSSFKTVEPVNNINFSKTKINEKRYKHERPNLSQTMNMTDIYTIPETPRELLKKRKKKFGRELFNIELYKIKKYFK